MTQQIELSYLVEHCTQLPTYKDALPLITLIQEWGAVHGAVAQAMEAINQIRDHFRQLMPKAPESEPKSLPMIDTPELPELKFFYQVSTQQFSDFKEALRNCLSKIDMYGKKEWFCIYAAWRFVCKERERAGGYVDFFVDINTLFPGLLKDLKRDEPGNRIYKPYTDMLSYEYKKWAVDGDHLPSMQIWAHSDMLYRYGNNKQTVINMQQLVRDFYKVFAPFITR